jgi:hypothetical protein
VIVVVAVVIALVLPGRNDDPSPGPTPSIAAGLEVRPVLAEESFVPASPTGTPQPVDTGLPAELRTRYDAMTACTTIVKGISSEPALGCDETTKYILGPARVSQPDLSSALALSNSQADGWLVEIRLTEQGAETLTALTTELAKLPGRQRQMAVILNGQILDVVPVTAPMTNGVFQVTQDYSQQRALSIAAALSSPAESGVTN